MTSRNVGGMQRRRLEEHVQALALTNITFIDPQPKAHMPELLAASDACVATFVLCLPMPVP